MRMTLGLAAVAHVLSTGAVASSKIVALDGSTWALDVRPDAMAKDSGEQAFKQTMKFVDGSVSLSVPKVGVRDAPYSVSRSGERGWAFQTKRASAAEGSSIWSGTVNDNAIWGKLVLTKSGGAVMIYTFKGFRLD